jgi:hypothetical protein
LLGRCRSYAKAADAGNHQLRALAAERLGFARNLQFAILQTLPLASTAMEVIEHERRHKVKLGTRTHGLTATGGSPVKASPGWAGDLKPEILQMR